MDEVKQAVAQVEKEMGKKFGDKNNTLLFSVRSGAAVSHTLHPLLLRSHFLIGPQHPNTQILCGCKRGVGLWVWWATSTWCVAVAL